MAMANQTGNVNIAAHTDWSQCSSSSWGYLLVHSVYLLRPISEQVKKKKKGIVFRVTVLTKVNEPYDIDYTVTCQQIRQEFKSN